MKAYDEMYLDNAMNTLGEAVDFAVNGMGMKMDEFLGLFTVSGIGKQFGLGNPKYVSGMSGEELVCEVLAKAGLKLSLPESGKEYDYSPEYWCGWILARYQWESGLPFERISGKISEEDLLRSYPALHEAPEEKSVETFNRMVFKDEETVRIQQIRRIRGYSQSELAKASGVNLRTLQQYESGAKNINRAAAFTLRELANALGCEADDLLEITPDAVH